MKVALVHDYLNEFGGAELVLLELTKMFPQAPIYTAFAVPGSTAMKAFGDKKIVQSWFAKLPGYKRLYSPLRFFIPWIWSSFDLKEFDVIISSASWYVTKGFDKKQGAVEICYCHTPPRWLYGFSTSVNMQKYWLVRMYAKFVGYFLRKYDYQQAQKVDCFVANSKNVADRIKKFYARDSVVVYPPVEMSKPKSVFKKDYYLIVSRLVGGKGIELAIEAAKKMNKELKIAGEFAGYKKISGVESLGRVNEEEKAKLMAEAKGFLALSKDEDFGITPVEAQICGTPVIAFNGGGYKESVVDGKTGILFEDYSVEGLIKAIERFETMKWETKLIEEQGKKFGADRFRQEMLSLVTKYARTTGN